MKKQIVLIVFFLGLIMTFSCEKSVVLKNSEAYETDLLKQFISSNDFNTQFLQNIYFSDIGNINLEESMLESIIVDKKEYNILNIAVYKNDKITGQIIGIKLPKNSKKLKTGHSYVMAFRDFREFNFETKSGIVRDYDLNFDGYNCGYIIVEDNYIQNINSLNMPYHIQAKYSFMKASNSKSVHPCDYSGDGDIGFGECYSCLKEAINSHGDTQFICDALNIIGTCSLAVGVSCIIISSTR